MLLLLSHPFCNDTCISTSATMKLKVIQPRLLSKNAKPSHQQVVRSFGTSMKLFFFSAGLLTLVLQVLFLYYWNVPLTRMINEGSVVWFNEEKLGDISQNRSSPSILEERFPAPPGAAVMGEAPDWFDEEKWKLVGDKNRCFYVEDLCHSLTHWFYKPSKSPKHQPRLLLDLLEPHYGHSHTHFTKFSPRYIVTQPATPATIAACTASPTPNHMILHSLFSKMLGEFYLRLISGLYVLSQQLQTNAGVDWDQFRAQTQMYIHKDLQYNILDSHHLFLAPFTSNPVLDFQRLLQNPKCRCMKRVFFCGYDAKYRHGSNSTILTLAGQINSGGELYKGGTRRNPALLWQDIRQFMKKSVLDEVTIPHLNYHLDKTRKHYCVQDKHHRCHGGGDVKIVGLAQRTLRRKWVDLDRLVNECNEQFQARNILCVEVNIEEAPFDHPIGHVLAHANLSALIGIHGSQLTDAIWMSEGSLLVELLPWIASGTSGQWTRMVEGPTPMGVMFRETDLNHTAYPLRKADTPGCEYSNITHPCGILWDNTDFRLPRDVLFDIVERFVLSSPDTCDEFQKAAGNEYVACNVNCKQNTSTNEVIIEHFYRPKEWLDSVTETA